MLELGQETLDNLSTLPASQKTFIKSYFGKSHLRGVSVTVTPSGMEIKDHTLKPTIKNIHWSLEIPNAR
jgi:hypothetical protein